MITVRAGIGGINEYIERIRNNIEGDVDNERNRVRFLKSEIDKDEFKRLTFLRYKSHDRIVQYGRILQTFVEMSATIMRDHLDTEQSELEGYTQLCNFRDMVNTDIEKIKDKKYESIHLISKNFTLTNEVEKRIIRRRTVPLCKIPNCIWHGLHLCGTHHYKFVRHERDNRERNGGVRRCKRIMVGGKRKGEECGRPTINLGGDRCLLHLEKEDYEAFAKFIKEEAN